MGRRLFYEVQVASASLQRGARAMLAPEALTPAQVGALFVVEAQEGCRLKVLAEALRINASAVTALVGRLEKAGRIELRACPEDGRARGVFLTAHGREGLAKARPMLDTLNAALEDAFTDEELEVVERFLRTTTALSTRLGGKHG